MKILFAAYRSWAQNVYCNLIDNDAFCATHEFELVVNKHDFSERLSTHKFDVIVTCGWSWIVPDEVVNNNYVVGLHPSDLPEYAGGTPIQNQIINGVTQTKMTLFKLATGIDDGPIIGKESISLSGNMQAIFRELTRASTALLYNFICDFPDINEVPQDEQKRTVFKRLKPEDSMLSREDVANKTCRELYDLMRCREDPYPNTYIEDETGRLYFSLVRFEK